MSQNIRELFKLTSLAGPAGGLEELVLARLEREQKRQAHQNLLIFGLLDLFSVTGLVAASFYLFTLLASSGFYNYLSLVWSDWGTLALLWQELLLSLVESLPLLGLTAFLIISLALMISLAKTLTSLRLFYYQFN